MGKNSWNLRDAADEADYILEDFRVAWAVSNALHGNLFELSFDNRVCEAIRTDRELFEEAQRLFIAARNMYFDAIKRLQAYDENITTLAKEMGAIKEVQA